MTTRSESLIACLSFTLAYGVEAKAKSPDPEAVVARFDLRVEQIFRAESGKPLVRAKKQKPLGPERGNYVRARHEPGRPDFEGD